jgi:hypothetical protein
VYKANIILNRGTVGKKGVKKVKMVHKKKKTPEVWRGATKPRGDFKDTVKNSYYFFVLRTF